MKELEYTKKRLQQQHEDDMEQLMALKKQLEKKVGVGRGRWWKWLECSHFQSKGFKR